VPLNPLVVTLHEDSDSSCVFRCLQNKYNAVLLILLVGSFLIPMLQYWWYIRDEEDTYE
jgi:hypothetical protein